MTPARIAELRALADAATPGPWDGTDYSVSGQTDGRSQFVAAVSCEVYDSNPRYAQDSAFIASARTAVPELLDEVERLRDALEEISASAGRCDAYAEGPNDNECRRPAVYYEEGNGAFGELNVCCDLPAHVRSHRDEIEKAKSKGSNRGRQARIEVCLPVAIARAAI